MMSIFLGDFDEQAIVEFVKQHKELYDKTHAEFKDKHRKEYLCERLVSTVKKRFGTQLATYGKLTQSQDKLQ